MISPLHMLRAGAAFALLCLIPSMPRAADAAAAKPAATPAPAAAAAARSPYALPGKELPVDWIDPDTGHRVVRLSSEGGTQSLYFHYNGYPKMGNWIVVTNEKGLAMIDMDTRETVQLREGRVRGVIAARKTPRVFFQQERTLYEQDVETKRVRKILELPEQIKGGSGYGLSADEKTLVGSYVTSDNPAFSSSNTRPDGTHFSLNDRWAARKPMALFAVDIASGDVTTFHDSTDWLNHLQMSPVDPALIMFCHEGPWHMVDRTWTIRTDASALTQIHHRTMNREIEGHEFFDFEGNIWYDLQTPRSVVFWLAGYDVKTQRRTWYHLKQEEWSVHYNISPDGKLFSGDGGGPGSVAAPNNGQWMYLFHPHLIEPIRGGSSDPDKLIRTGWFESEKLVNLAKHDYALEPNGSFTPDGKWLVFRSNMLGETHVFKVEIAAAADARAHE